MTIIRQRHQRAYPTPAKEVEIPTCVVSKLTKINLGAYEMRVLLCLCKFTYGCGEDEQDLSLREYGRETGLTKANVSKAMGSLERRRIVLRRERHRKINMITKEWKEKEVKDKEGVSPEIPHTKTQIENLEMLKRWKPIQAIENVPSHIRSTLSILGLSNSEVEQKWLEELRVSLANDLNVSVALFPEERMSVVAINLTERKVSKPKASFKAAMRKEFLIHITNINNEK